MSLTLANPVVVPRLGLAEHLLGLRRRWKLILMMSLIIPALPVGAFLNMPSSYTATGTLLYDPAAAAIPGDLASPLADIQSNIAATASQADVIDSLPAAQTLAARLDAANLPAFNPALTKPRWPLSLFWRGKPPGAAALARMIETALRVSVAPGSRVLRVSFTSTDPAVAARAANLAMQIYIDQQRDQSFASLTDAQSWLLARAADTQAGLDRSEASLAQARAAAGILQGAQSSLSTTTANHLAASLDAAQADLALNEARLDMVNAADSAGANAAVDPSLMPLRKEQADLTAQVQSLADEYGQAYPLLQQARTQLATIDQQIGVETGREVDAARAEVAADHAQIATLRAALAASKAQSDAQAERSAPTQALEQKINAKQAILRAMTLQADQLAQDASLTRPDARIVSAAMVPSSPDTAHRLLILAASIVLGVSTGILLAGVADALDTSFRSGEDLRNALALPCLAMVPEVPSPRQAALAAPFSLFAEQLRALRTGLALVPGTGRVIAVTAARPGEGKTTVTIALARALAASGLHVLAVDGDIRQPSFNAEFGIGGAPGLTDHLAGLAALDDVLLRDEGSPLSIIGAGTQALPALSLLLSPELSACFAALRARFDVVLLDVPPAFALAEGRVMAKTADCALFCVQWGRTPRRVVQGAVQLLRESGVNITGTVLTRVNVRQHAHSGYADAEMYQPRYGGYFRE
ncbi:MAG: formate--tetrahydrofolate ligase [Acidocella sp.]|nr:formate--tetrahydrofolate ligase [Acidocella sp.]